MNSQGHPSRDKRFEDLYRTTAADLLAFLTRRASDPEAAADLLAEVYLVAWRRLDKLPGDEGARLWLFGVARNLIMKNSQRQQSHQALISELTHHLTRLADYRPEATDDGHAERIRTGLDKLPAKQREVLLLTAWEGLKPREIAKVTGTTANIVRVRLHHARQALARELRPRASPAEDPDKAPSSRCERRQPPDRRPLHEAATHHALHQLPDRATAGKRGYPLRTTFTSLSPRAQPWSRPIRGPGIAGAAGFI